MSSQTRSRLRLDGVETREEDGTQWKVVTLSFNGEPVVGRHSVDDDDPRTAIRAVALSPDGSLSVRMSATGTPESAADLGARLARDMLAEGAGELTDAPPAETVRRQ